MNKNIIYILLTLFVSVLVCQSCKKDEVPDEDDMPKINVEVPDLELDEEGILPTRTSLAYVNASKKMLFNWENGDRVGVFNVFSPASEARATLFSYIPNSGAHDDGTTATARFINSNYSFDQEHLWVAYCPALCVSSGEGDDRVLITNYEEFQLTYRGQTQSANGTPKGEYPDDTDSGYTLESEAKASQHLGAYDYLISDPSKPSEDGQMTFKFSHVGSTVRFYVLFPEGAFGGNGKVGRVTSMSVINEEGQLVSDVKLKIKPQTSITAVTPSYEEVENSKITTKQLTLNFCDEQGEEGVEVPDYGYFIAYMKFYPVKLAAGSYLHFTVMVDGVKKYFKSKPLTAKNMKPGKLYQWTTGDFNTPIELTATLLPWEDIQGGTISTGDE